MSRESVAIEILKNPERFTSLPKRAEFERQVVLWKLPSFEPHSSWSIFKNKKSGDYHVRRLEHDPSRGFPGNSEDPDVFGAEAQLPAEIGVSILEEFEALKAPIFRKPAYMGMDGTLFGVQMGNFWQSTSVTWWSHTTPDWQPLCALFDLKVEQLDSYLPASTLRMKR